MAMACSRVPEWIEAHVSKPVEEWENQRKQECKKRHWYDPRSWFCWFTTYLVKIIRWVVVTVVKMILTIVCRIIERVVSIVLDLIRLVYHLIKALVTWDGCVLQEALSDLADALVGVFTILYVIVDPIVGEVNVYRLRGYVSDQIDERFRDQPELAQALKEAFQVDSGVFGFRVQVSVYRMYVDSQTRTRRYTDVPNLLGLHRDGLIDLYALAGFTTPCDVGSKEGWYRPRPQRAKYPFATGGGGFGEPVPPEFTREELDEYISSNGEKGPHFRIYAIRPDHFDDRIDAAEEKGRRLGLVLRFDRREIGVTDEHYIKWSEPIQPSFLIDELGRHDKNADPSLAACDLCSPVSVAVFGFENRTLRGWTNVIAGSDCPDHNLDADRVSGCSWIDDIPDEVRRYVLIHELGHYFGLCHVDGFDHIMVSGAQGEGKLTTGGAVFFTVALGGPRFTVDEGQRAWRYILSNFPTDCLLGHECPPAPSIP